MKKLACSIAVAGLIGTPAFAADMAVKSAPMAPAPAVYNWTGFYVGVNAGASMGNVKTDFNTSGVGISSSSILCVNGCVSASGPGFTSIDTTSPDGFIGGGQIGYNWQFSPIFVGGVEADFQGALEKDHNHPSTPFSATGTVCGVLCDLGLALPSAFSASGSQAFDYETKIDWFGTVRARLGYVWGNGQVMSYLTGGLAYGKVSINGTGTLAVSGFPSVTQSFTDSHVNTGWVIGYGNEGALDFWGSHNWTWKVETLYMDLGHLHTTAPGGSVTSCTILCLSSTTTSIGPISTNSHFTDWILRGGLNYRF